MLAESDFQRALNTLLGHEGTALNPSDPGGGSKYGVLQATYTEWLRNNGRPYKNIKDISLPEVVSIYRTNYWTASGAPSLPYDLAAIHFDAAVNMGVGTAKKLLATSGGTVAGYIAARQAEYKAIVQRNPAKAKYLTTWLNRAASFASSTTGKVVGGGLGLVALLIVGALALKRR